VLLISAIHGYERIRMKLPAEVKIGGREYKITFPYLFQDNAQVLYGLHDPGMLSIRISEVDESGNKRTDFALLQTFLHELIHAVDYVYNQGALTRSDNGERTIDQLAEGLLQVLRDNEINFSNQAES
jgi:hypothetical protein